MTSTRTHGQRKPAATAAAVAQPQTQLQVGAADDQLERAADEAADRALCLLASSPDRSRAVQRSATDTDGGDAIGPQGGPLDNLTSDRIERRRGTGNGLPADVRTTMESAFGGADFGGVRLHTGAESAALNTRVGAQAFTVDQDIFLGAGTPDLHSRDGQHLLAHELAHTQQQRDGAARRKVQRKGKSGKKAGPGGPQPTAPVVRPDAIVTDWVNLSGVKGALGKKARSKELVRIDTAVATWVTGGMTVQGAIDLNVTQLQEILDAVTDWQATKKGASDRDSAIAALVNYVTPVSQRFAGVQLQNRQDQAVADPLFDRFKKIDAETGRFAGKNTVDIKSDRFRPSKQTPGLMAHTKKNDDGTLTDEAMDELDQDQIAEAQKLRDTAHGAMLTVDPQVTTRMLKKLMAADDQKNSLTGRTKVPELGNLTAPNAQPVGEVTEDINGFDVTYDKSDVHAAERLAALTEAVRQITAAGIVVPRLDVFFPKYGREIKVDKDCKVTVGAKIADAVFHPPNFLAVSSANTGNPKDDLQGDGDLKFLSARLGADQALVHTLIHELGHALHYDNARGQFYNLNFAFFKGKAPDGRSYQSIATEEVSGYGSNPREMVAEVFVGAVTGKMTFSDIVWEMYDAFGGVPVAH